MNSLLRDFSDELELFLNILELLALSVSLGTFFSLMLNQFSQALKKIFSVMGLGFWPRIRIIIICRKSAALKRAFIEYAILRTQGYPVIASEWHSIINEFKNYYKNAEGRPTYSIPNCTILINEEFSQATNRYFTVFNNPKVKKAFGVKDDNLQWETKIHIEEAYITPTCLLTGLLSTYEENWTEFITRYVSSAYLAEADDNNDSSILTNELYMTFAWLLWGPSFEINYKDYWMGLCQVSFGDESNSFPAIVKKSGTTLSRLAARFIENQDHRYGALMSIDISLYDKKRYIRSIRDSINRDNEYFYDKVDNGVFSFVAQIDDFSPNVTYKSKKYYCTAYVWLLIELDTEDYAFHPEKCVAFFEHANLADRNTYRFLTETLIDKSIKHFTDVFNNPEYSGRKYRYVCAMNKEIEELFMEKYKSILDRNDDMGEKFRERLSLTPKHTPSEAFVAFDDYFVQSENFIFSEVDIENKNSISDLGRFYTEIYIECFPDSNERETFDNLLYYLKNARANSSNNYHIILLKDNNNKILGGAIFDYFGEINSGMIEFVAVRNDSQSSGIGSVIYNHIIETLSADAYAVGKKKLEYVFCEIDSPEYSQASIKKYLYFWDKQKYRHIDFDYIQPSLSPTQDKVTGLWLAVTTLQSQADVIPSNVVLKTIEQYMKWSMQISNPFSNPDYIEMMNSVKERPELRLLKIIE